MVKNAVSCRDVVVVRGDREVLQGLDFDLHAGTVTGLLGPSGCGKTTLIRAIVGLQAKVTGDVSVLGLPAGASKLRGRIGYVTQEPSVYGDLTVTENLRFFAAVLGVGSSDVERVIEAVDLGSHADVRVDRLSGGQRSRASLACALPGSPAALRAPNPRPPRWLPRSWAARSSSCWTSRRSASIRSFAETSGTSSTAWPTT